MEFKKIRIVSIYRCYHVKQKSENFKVSSTNIIDKTLHGKAILQYLKIFNYNSALDTSNCIQ